MARETRGWYKPALMLSIATVLGRSALGGRGCFSGYSVVLNSVLIRVDFPSPDSPIPSFLLVHYGLLGDSEQGAGRTDDHGGELETLADAFTVHLIGKVGEPNVAHELFPDGTTVGGLAVEPSAVRRPPVPVCERAKRGRV